MADQFHVNGSAGIYVGQGVGGSRLGYATADGVTVRFSTAQVPVYSDERGPSVQGEQLNNGTVALIGLDLMKYDNTVLENLMAKREGGTLGQFSGAGILMFYNELTYGLTIASPIDGKNYYFPRAWLNEEPIPVSLSTQSKIWGLNFAAVPNSNGVLYQFV